MPLHARRHRLWLGMQNAVALVIVPTTLDCEGVCLGASADRRPPPNPPSLMQEFHVAISQLYGGCYDMRLAVLFDPESKPW
jgi:hypothetical protein